MSCSRGAIVVAALLATPAAAEWRVERVVDAGSMPWGVIATGSDIYVAHVGYRGRDNVWRYDADLRVQARAKFAGHAVELVLAPDGKTLYAGNSRANTIVALDPVTLAVRAQYATGSGPKDLCVAPDGKTLYAGNFNTNTVSVVDVATRAEKRIVVGGGPRGLDTDGAKLYVASLRGSRVDVIDTQTLAITATIRGCKGAAHTALTPDGALLLVTCYGARHVQVIDVATDKAIRQVEVGAGPNPIAIAGSVALVGNEFADSLSAIDLATWTVTTTKLPIDRPVGVAIAPDGKRAFVTGRGSTKLVEVRLAR